MCTVQPDERHAVVASYGINNADNLGMLFEIPCVTVGILRWTLAMSECLWCARLSEAHRQAVLATRGHPHLPRKGSTWRPTEAQISNIQAAVSTRLPALLATIDTFTKSDPNTPLSSSSSSRYIPSTPLTSGNSKAGSSLSSSTHVGKCALSPNMEMEGRRSKWMDNDKVCEVTDYDIELTDDEVEAEIVPNDNVLGEVIEIVEVQPGEIKSACVQSEDPPLSIGTSLVVTQPITLYFAYRAALSEEPVYPLGMFKDHNRGMLPGELSILNEKHAEYQAFKLGSVQRKELLDVTVEALQKASPHLQNMQLLTVHKKVLHFFKNDRVRKIQGGGCVPPNARMLFSMHICHDGASALWVNSEEGRKVWNASLEREKASGAVNDGNRLGLISSLKASLFKKLPVEEQKEWAKKADALHKEEENMSLDEVIAINQETLFITVAMGLKALIGSECGQAGEDVGFHVKMVYKPRDGVTCFTCVDVMLNQESGRFSTFEGGSEAECLWWTCFAEQVFLVPAAVNRKADDVTGKPVLLKMEDDWTPVRVRKTLKEYLKGLWNFSHHPVMDPPDLPWNELNDPICDVVPETWRGSLGDPEKMKAVEVMALYLWMHNCQNTAMAFHFVVHPEDIEGRKNVNILGKLSHGSHIIILELEEDDNDDDSVVVLSPSHRKLNLTKSKGARVSKENKHRSDCEHGEGEHEGECEHGIDGQHHDDDREQHDSIGSGHDNDNDGGQRDDVDGGQMRRGQKCNQPPRCEGEDDPDVPQGQVRWREGSEGSKDEEGMEAQTTSTNTDMDTMTMMMEDSVTTTTTSVQSLNSDTDAEARMTTSGRQDAKAYRCERRMEVQTTSTNTYSEPESASNARVASGSSKETSCRGSVAGEKRLTRAATLPASLPVSLSLLNARDSRVRPV
ncbi:hypothetical protein BKA93DRAFT_751360 [Sparassis latifolia]